MPKLSTLISPAYLKTQIELHKRPKGYGGGGAKWGAFVAGVVAGYCRTDPSVEAVLDYGAGQGGLGQFLRNLPVPIECHDYDPAFPGFKGSMPELREVVACTDVMEHVEEDKVEAVLRDIAANTGRVAVIVIALTEANKLLPDGRNAHITLKPASWWRDQLERRFSSLIPIEPDMSFGPAPIRPEKEIGFLCLKADY